MVFEAWALWRELQAAKRTGDPVKIAKAQKRHDDWVAPRLTDEPFGDGEEVISELKARVDRIEQRLEKIGG